MFSRPQRHHGMIAEGHEVSYTCELNLQMTAYEQYAINVISDIPYKSCCAQQCVLLYLIK